MLWRSLYDFIITSVKSQKTELGFFVFSVTDERESVQKKTFQKWVNSHLVRVSCRISDLYVDLRDGKMLLKLLEVLSGERLVSGEMCI
jgi:hypothetical protein